MIKALSAGGQLASGMAIAAAMVLLAGCSSGASSPSSTTTVTVTAPPSTAPASSTVPSTPAALSLSTVSWKNVTISGQLCKDSSSITLQNGSARVASSGYGPLDVTEQGVIYGQLPNGTPVAALQVWCDNQGGTAAGQLAEGYLVFTGTGGHLTQVAALTPRYGYASHVHIPYLISVNFSSPGAITQTVYYKSTDADCCPSGKATTTWTWNGTTFTAGPTVVH